MSRMVQMLILGMFLNRLQHVLVWPFWGMEFWLFKFCLE